MASVPDTENVYVAAMAVATEIAARPMDGTNRDHFQDRLERFLTAYRAVLMANDMAAAGAASIDVKAIIDGQKS